MLRYSDAAWNPSLLPILLVLLKQKREREPNRIRENPVQMARAASHRKGNYLRALTSDQHWTRRARPLLPSATKRAELHR